MPAGAVRAILIAEGVRRLLNTSPELVETDKPALMKDFNMMLYRNGHKYKFRIEIIDRVLEKYDN